jgi:hypothetical protein
MKTVPRYLSTKTKSFTITRRALPTMVKGRPVEGQTVEVVIKANVQPLPRSTLLKLQLTGDTSSAAYAVFSNSMMRMQVEGKWDADIITIDGFTYELVEVVGYSMGVLDHYEAVALRKELAS